MPLDAICLSALTAELHAVLENAKVDKITQPEQDEIVLHLRTATRDNVKLLLAANPAVARLHLTSVTKENPATPPMFCMLLRKHLGGARLLSVTQLPNERVVLLTFSGFDDLGDATTRILLLELIHRSANLYFLDAEHRILSALRHGNTDITSERPNLPGLHYLPPSGIDKYNPLTLGVFDWRRIFSNGQGSAEKHLMASCCGFSPLLAREAVYRAVGDCDAVITSDTAEVLAIGCFTFFSALQEQQYMPTLILADGKPKDFTCVEPQQFQGAWTVEPMDTFSQLLERFYAERAHADSIKRKASGLTKTVKNNIDRIKRKLTAQRLELDNAQNREHWRKQGELLKANLHKVRKGAASIEVEDYYAEDCPTITLTLDPLLTPQQNAAKLFKEYAKAKTAEAILTERLTLGEQELRYWESVQEAIERSTTERELADIRAELKPEQLSRKGKKQTAQSKPHLFIATSGLRIWAGRNNTQNEALTLQTAGKNDWWLHVQNQAGAHVIIETRGTMPDTRTFTEAAIIAVTLSAAKNGVKVPVDYTQIKNVKKLPKSKPGMVTYTEYKTILADADERLLDTLRETI